MKKFALILILFFLALAGCSKNDVDPYKTFRNKTSAQLFNAGEKALAKNNDEEAVKNFEASQAIYPFGPHAQQVDLDIIYAYYKSDDSASAIAAADRYIRLYPRGPYLDYAYYMRGIVNYEAGLSWLQRLADVDPSSRDMTSLQQSFASFAMLVKNFPYKPNAGTPNYTPDALTRMWFIRNLIAQREVRIARFYMGRQAYVAAANRAVDVVEHFQGSPAVIPALAIMVQAYRALHLTEMADATAGLLQLNYPNAPESRRSHSRRIF